MIRLLFFYACFFGGTICYFLDFNRMLDDQITLKVEELNRTGNKVEAYNLVWADEFEMDGAPDKTKWGFNIGNGSNGWGNNESQYYTDRLANAKIDNGHLVITAKKEAINNFYYSSARMLTKDKFEFTYGKIEIRAKLPYGRGTWPAFWLLGANIDEVGWPKCGEIDIMEHVGNNLNTVQSAIHTPSSFGNTSNLGSQNIDNVSGEFHIYTLEWTNEELIFAVDNNVHYIYKPSEINDKTWPFNEDMFIILNIAMGGNLGGKIDPEFKEAKMLIDYVRVYQK